MVDFTRNSRDIKSRKIGMCISGNPDNSVGLRPAGHFREELDVSEITKDKR